MRRDVYSVQPYVFCLVSSAAFRTHLNEKGQMLFGRMVADTLIRTQVELGPDVIGESFLRLLNLQVSLIDSTEVRL